jgi:hypothetical protein
MQNISGILNLRFRACHKVDDKEIVKFLYAVPFKPQIMPLAGKDSVIG